MNATTARDRRDRDDFHRDNCGGHPPEQANPARDRCGGDTRDRANRQNSEGDRACRLAGAKRPGFPDAGRGRSRAGWAVGAIALPLGLAIAAAPAWGQRTDRPGFFEDGYDRLEREIERLNQPEPEAERDRILTVSGDRLQWQRAIFRSVGASVWLPLGVMQQDMETVPLLPTGEAATFERVESQQADSRFVVAYSDPLPAAALTDPAATLNAVAAHVAAPGWSVSEPQAIAREGWAGLAWTLESAPERIWLNAYLIGDRAMVLAVGSRSGTDDLAEAAALFFDSLEQLP